MSKIKNTDEAENHKQLFYAPESRDWKDLSPNLDSVDDKEKSQELSDADKAKGQLKEFLLTSLQMQHVAVLAGSGTSLDKAVSGPSMVDLWKTCVNAENGGGTGDTSPEAKEVIDKVGYDQKKEGDNIEALLSRCDAFQQINSCPTVAKFIKESKKSILKKCSQFIDLKKEQQLSAHRTFLHHMSRRRVRDSRLKLFTTNYDLCFENAAGQQGLVVLDGFSLTEPRSFDPRFFLYDIVRRSIGGDETGTPLEGVFHLYKLHGSVNWSRTKTKGGEKITVKANPRPESAALIYPVNGKYQQSYIQPHLELISQYLATLREPNTCLIVVGFGFNDNHLSEPILTAVRTNPHFRLIVVNPSVKDQSDKNGTIWKELYSLAKRGEDVWLINASFSEFAEMTPDLKTLSPEQQLSRAIENIAGQS